MEGLGKDESRHWGAEKPACPINSQSFRRELVPTLAARMAHERADYNVSVTLSPRLMRYVVELDTLRR